MKAMKIIREFIALTAMLFGMIGWAGDSAPFLLDTTDPLITAPITYNSSWVGGDSSAEVVISADGTEIKRTTGEGEFVWTPTTAGKHTLTYTTYINGVAQDEVYTATVFKDWKYTVEDGKATIVETTKKSGSVTIPSEIDGLPVVGFGRDVFAGCENITTVAMPGNLVTKMSDIFPDSYDKLISITLTGDVTGLRRDAFDGCSSIVDVVMEGDLGDKVFPGFYEAEFRSMSSFDDSRSIIDNSRGIVLSADMLTADTTDELTMYGYAAQMYFEGGVEYGFLPLLHNGART